MLRIGLIGAGWAGERHAQAVLAQPDRAQLAAVAEPDRQRLDPLCETWGVTARFTDYQDLFAKADLDAVSICLPHALHAEAAIIALAAGRHVLVEKPLASTLAQADAMIAAADQANRVLLVAENVRYDPKYIQAAALIHAGALGEVFLIRIQREHHMHAYLDARPWFLHDPAGGIMMSGGVHDFEILRMLAGEIENVYAVAAPRMHFQMHADDTSLAVVEFQCGIRAVLQESFSTHTPRPGVSGVVYGRDGTLWIEPEGLKLYRESEDGHPEQVETIAVKPVNTFDAVLEHFLDCVEGKAAPLTSGVEQRKTLRAVLAAYRAMETGIPVKVTDLDNKE